MDSDTELKLLERHRGKTLVRAVSREQDLICCDREIYKFGYSI